MMQCRKKMTKLCEKYRQICGHNNVLGRNHNYSLPQLNAVLGHIPSTEPRSVIESCNNNSTPVYEGSGKNLNVEDEESEGVTLYWRCLLVYVFTINFTPDSGQASPFSDVPAVKVLYQPVNLGHRLHKKKRKRVAAYHSDGDVILKGYKIA